ncbi:hypothetical protein DL766_005114 [Monosporascus sp. MC13-8B]|nr:hypothetical protein DL766_005114 [Monosporascus sp. MC13-8B]
MLHQCERVPRHYVLEEEPTPLGQSVSRASIALHSTDDTFPDPCRFYIEAINSKVFRTTFTTSQHPVPPYPSAKRPDPKFLDVTAPKISTDPARRSGTIKLGSVEAVIEWTDSPTVSLFLEGSPEPIHRDLQFRSYAIDGTGIAHYSVYKKDTLHVGLGEKAAPMDLSGRGFIISASDTFGYDAYRTDPLYKHIPLLINVTPSGCVGIFSTSHSRASWAVGSEIDGLWGRFKVYRQAHGGLEEYLIVGHTVADVVRSYAELVGFPLLVPRYMMGYIGGGMKYSMGDSPPASEGILNFIEKCKEHGMPCSAFQMSSGYTVAETEPKTRNVFTWNRHRFPNPREFTGQCHRHGVRLLANIKPYVLASHPAYEELERAGAFFTDLATKKTAVARLWSAGGGESGEGSHIDFTSKAGFEWWYNGVRELKRAGIDAMWNDNNEYNITNDEWQCALDNIPIPPGETRKHIGLWGRALHTELNGKSSYDATVEIDPNTRPFILTRSATAGTMRYCASSWSGDNVTSWEGMRGANSLALNAGFSLLQCYGHDIGGFEGPQPTPEHLVRWVQLGVHSPRFAINCYKTSPDDNLVGDVIEPWQYPSVTPIIQEAIKRRYELVPYTYSLMLKSHLEAIPPQRWTGWGYESDPEVWTPALLKGDTQYWFGDAMLVSGVYEPGVSTARVYLPGHPGDPGFLNLNAPYQYLAPGRWHEISSPWKASIPVLARIGSAIPVGKPEPTTCLADGDREFSGMEQDDWRGVEIFPSPLHHDSISPIGDVTADATNTGETKPEIMWYQNTWLEDDGISPAGKADACTVNITYGVARDHIQIKARMEKQGGFEPLWARNGIHVNLPVGEERVIISEEAAVDIGRDGKGRRVWKNLAKMKLIDAVLADLPYMHRLAPRNAMTFTSSIKIANATLAAFNVAYMLDLVSRCIGWVFGGDSNPGIIPSPYPWPGNQ